MITRSAVTFGQDYISFWQEFLFDVCETTEDNKVLRNNNIALVRIVTLR